jgi:hypothetical protein
VKKAPERAIERLMPADPPLTFSNGLATEGTSGECSPDFFAEIGRRTALSLPAPS